MIVTDEAPQAESRLRRLRSFGETEGMSRGPYWSSGAPTSCTAAHCDGIVPNATVEMDVRVVLDAGEYHLDFLHETDEPIGARDD